MRTDCDNNLCEDFIMGYGHSMVDDCVEVVSNCTSELHQMRWYDTDDNV